MQEIAMINNLTAEEEDILASYERDEWKSIDNLQEEMNAYRQAASAWIKQNHTISLTLPEEEFEQFQKKALSTGASSQTILINLIRQFIAS
jgi:predicted DNA binding CopG/RHH family protein